MPTYHIKNSGNDASTGLSDAQAWTFTKLATFIPANGDVILFNRGETFFGTLTLRKSGISGAGITYGAYGTGSDPVISSLKLLTGWVNHSGNIWRVAAGIQANCGIVTLNDAPVEKGHWPATGFAVWDSSTFTLKYITSAVNYNTTVAGTTLFTTSAAHGLSNGTMITILGTASYDGYYSANVINSTTFYITKAYVSSQSGTLTYNTTITDAGLPVSPNLTGAELVLYKSNWTIDRSLITNHTNHTLTYSSGSSWAMQTSGGKKYLVQNSLACLTYHGAWYCDGTNFYMYLDTAPENYVIKAGSADYTISLDRKNYNIVQDLTIEGGNLSSHYFLSSTYHQILRCTIKNAGITGITGITNGVTGASTNTRVEDCTIKNIGGSGAWINSAGSIITGNLFEDVGEFAGMGDKGGGSHYGIYIKGVGSVTEYNRFDKIGYIPINFYSNDSIIRYNVISNHTKLGLDDGGAIYTYYGIEDTAQSGIKVYNNIIFTPLNGNGLYLDNLSNNQEWYNNTIIGVTKWPIHCNMPQLNNIHDNTVFGCGLAAIDVANLTAQNTTASGNTVSGNLFVQTAADQNMFSLRDARNNDIINFGTSNGNTFIVSDAASDLFYNQKSSPYAVATYNLTEWIALTGEEATSTVIVKDLSKMSVQYNDTKVELTISLSTPKKDLSGTVYATEITLQPFTSIILEDTVIAPVSGSHYQVDNTGKYLVDNTGKYLYAVIE